ncbi:MAG: DNA-3-methyladenine glycosylase I [Candidatus Melainabacteria bacterium]|jgi:DNA-3-methyladenine glycosylase I|nr:DNA-3-methyladenine glycosylase I [Candidatus Melainabacteria bacterium]
MQKSQTRCSWANPKNPLYVKYHDEEWGLPVHDDNKLFEMLILEGAQAGLSWETVLNKREGYRKAFNDFDVKKVAKMTDGQLEKLMSNEKIIRNHLKIFSARKNAIVFLEIQKEFGSFDKYLWAFTGGKTIKNQWQRLKEIPATSSVSDALSKDLKKRGMSFVGSTIVYAFMQATGMVNDHTVDCFRYS